jgi:hypothetical protein
MGQTLPVGQSKTIISLYNVQAIFIACGGDDLMEVTYFEVVNFGKH